MAPFGAACGSGVVPVTKNKQHVILFFLSACALVAALGACETINRMNDTSVDGGSDADSDGDGDTDSDTSCGSNVDCATFSLEARSVAALGSAI